MPKKKKGAGGRPTLLNVTIASNVINALRGGSYTRTACEFAGITEASFHSWRGRGEVEIDRVIAMGGDAEGILAKVEILPDGKARELAELFADRPEEFDETEWPFVVFSRQVKSARAQAEVRAIMSVRAAFGDNWQAAAWFLERTAPDRFGRRDRINHEGPKIGGPVEVVTVEQLEEKLGGLLKDNKDE